MSQDPGPPLGPPPRKASIRRGPRAIRNAYGTLFALLVLVFGGWAVFDAFHWPSLSTDEQLLTVAFGVGAVLAIIIYRLVDHPMRRELRLARRGEWVRGRIVSVGRRHNRRATPFVAYTFRTIEGETIEAQANLPARFPVETLSPGAELDLLYDPTDPRVSVPMVALEYVEFPEEEKKPEA